MPTDLKLDGNEGEPPPASLLDAGRAEAPALLRDYPKARARALERQIAALHDLPPARVLVTAGGDDALDRACRTVLGPGRELIFPSPSFEMLLRYARLTGGDIVEVPWPRGPYPTDAVIDRVGPTTGMIAVVTPNNPTGAVATARDLERLSAAAPEAILLVDLAYTEFADEDLTPAALRLPNALCVRTLSKAYGLAGLRVGYALGHERLIGWMRCAGAPYPVSGLSLRLAGERLATGDTAVRRFIAAVRHERAALAELLRELGAEPLPSQANFVIARFRDELWVRDALAGLGIAVRIFPGRDGLERCLRTSTPGNAAHFERLTHGLRTALAPQALLFDMDGVLADVSGSYRQAIIRTAARFGVTIDREDVARAKAEGDANNDWVLTQRLLAARGVDADLSEVTARFEEIYQGTDAAPGLRATETLIPERATLERLAAKLPLAVVTGRPRSDAEHFLQEHRIGGLFGAVVCMEDTAELKPHPAPVLEALRRLGVERGWLVGDTVDDVRAARAARVVPLGFAAPGEEPEALARTLARAGAARTMVVLDQIEEWLP
jgi:HAD superfamily hydrolase (TIGR01548 family)